MTSSDPPTPEPEVETAVPPAEDQRHQEILQVADEALAEAGEAIIRARQRLVRANLVYEERMRGRPAARH